MAEYSHPPTDAELERALTDLGQRLTYPPTPEMVQGVRRRLAVEPARPWLPWAIFAAPRWRLVLPLLVLALLAGVGLLLAPAARSTIAERLGLQGITITYLPAVPAATAETATSLGLGEPVSLEEAQARVPYQILLPSLPELGPPDAVYIGGPPLGDQVTLLYHPRSGSALAADEGVGLLLTQFRGDLVTGEFGKGLAPDTASAPGPGTRLEGVTVNGGRGYWIEGQSHLFFYRDATGRVREERTRLAGNVLLWEQAGLTLRLEAALTKAEALWIAASLR